MEFFYFLGVVGIIVMIVAFVRSFSAQQEISNLSKELDEMKKDAERQDMLRYLFEEQAKMIINDIQHDYMVEFTGEQWEQFLKEDNPALAAFSALPKVIPPIAEFRENIIIKGDEFLYGFDLSPETVENARRSLAVAMKSTTRKDMVSAITEANEEATGEYAFMKNTINYDWLCSGALMFVANEINSEELAACVMRHAEKKGWINSNT